MKEKNWVEDGGVTGQKKKHGFTIQTSGKLDRNGYIMCLEAAGRNSKMAEIIKQCFGVVCSLRKVPSLSLRLFRGETLRILMVT